MGGGGKSGVDPKIKQRKRVMYDELAKQFLLTQMQGQGSTILRARSTPPVPVADHGPSTTLLRKEGLPAGAIAGTFPGRY